MKNKDVAIRMLLSFIANSETITKEEVGKLEETIEFIKKYL